MEKEAKKNATDTLQTHDQKLEKMKEIGMKLKELQKAEKKAAENTQKADKKA